MFKKILILTLFLYFTTVNANFSTSHSKTIDDNDEIHITHSSYIYDVSSMPERVKNNDYVFIGRIISETGVSYYDGTLSSFRSLIIKSK